MHRETISESLKMNGFFGTIARRSTNNILIILTKNNNNKTFVD